MKMIDVSVMASNISPTFRLCLADNESNASYEALKKEKIFFKKFLFCL